ncbi:MAG TPA: hypothetical protein VIL20_02400, partial [Sandaracinaceae bacterium]
MSAAVFGERASISAHEDARALLQRRVAGFALGVGALSFAALLARLAATVAGGLSLPFLPP